jgi:bifunctional non-homologous end joining protein LigD
MFEHAAKLNWEGIISKRADAPYRSERTEAWRKIKTVQKGNSRSSGLSKILPGLRRSISEKRRQRPGLHRQGGDGLE